MTLQIDEILKNLRDTADKAAQGSLESAKDGAVEQAALWSILSMIGTVGAVEIELLEKIRKELVKANGPRITSWRR